MRQRLNTSCREQFSALVHLVRLRGWVVVLVICALVGLMASIGHSVPNLQQDPEIPPTRTPLLVATALASSVVLLLRPILPEAERLADRSMRATRVSWCGALVAVASSVAVVATTFLPAHVVLRCTCTAAALTGVALALAPFGAFAALAGPWLYVISGLAFGYDTTVQGPAQLRPWAWLVDPERASLTSELVTLVVGLAVFVLVPPRIDRD